MGIIINVLTLILLLTSVFLVLVVLMQRAKSDGGVAAMGGGSMESTFGADTNNVLTGATIKAAVVFFLVSFVLYLAHIKQTQKQGASDNQLPTVVAPATPPASTTPAPAPQPATNTPVEPKKP